MKKLVITGRGAALERFAREQRLRFKREGFKASFEGSEDVKDAPVADTKEVVPEGDVKDAPVEDVKDEPEKPKKGKK